MTTTAGDLCAASFKLIGVLSEGETMTPEMAADAFSRLNEIVDGLGVQRFTMLVRTRTVFSPIANQSTYTIGPSGADWTLARPVTIEGAGLILTSSNPTIEIPLTPLTDDQYQAVGIKALTSTLPTEFYYNPTIASGWGTFFLWPTPTTAANTIAIYVPTAITQFTNLATSVILAPMYAKAFRYILGAELAIEFGRPITPTVQKVFDIAAECWSQIKAVNVHMSDLSMDPGLTTNSTSASIYNVLTDSYPSGGAG